MVDETKNEETLEEKEDSNSPSEEKTKEDTSESKKEDTSEQNIDYKKLLEEEKKKRKDDRKKFFTKKEDEDYDPEPSLTPEEIEGKIAEKVKENVTALERRIFESNAKSWATQLSENPEEKELMLYHYNNSIVPSGDVEKDMKRCQLLANEGRIEAKERELKRALAKEPTGTGSGAGQKLPIPPEKPVMTEADRKVKEKAGKEVEWDPKLKTWVRWDKNKNKWIGPNGEIGTLPPLKP